MKDNLGVNPSIPPEHAARILRRRRPGPHSSPNIDLSNYVYGAQATWSEWKSLRGYGLVSWLKWLVTLGSVTQQEGNWIKHCQMVDQKQCHTWNNQNWCYCGHARAVAGQGYGDPETELARVRFNAELARSRVLLLGQGLDDRALQGEILEHLSNALGPLSRGTETHT